MPGTLAHPPVIAAPRLCCCCRQPTVLVMANVGGGFDPWCRACGQAVYLAEHPLVAPTVEAPMRAASPVRQTKRHRLGLVRP